jgi:hypothetical protein
MCPVLTTRRQVITSIRADLRKAVATRGGQGYRLRPFGPRHGDIDGAQRLTPCIPRDDHVGSHGEKTVVSPGFARRVGYVALRRGSWPHMPPMSVTLPWSWRPVRALVRDRISGGVVQSPGRPSWAKARPRPKRHQRKKKAAPRGGLFRRLDLKPGAFTRQASKRSLCGGASRCSQARRSQAPSSPKSRFRECRPSSMQASMYWSTTH